ncbi:uncharacterized protein PGTG_03455 [Puccinia graminis f. sp. tritici CRL 75-36-700-3]|uniref:Uncharacterized protein n=1 Tax=Puccinia graminis f. sp. tritici (strain CRL 75-36-700-3 / race SCCL) TaxID=418459 RepID=E3JZM4_PUCGT|nr:uncharacterized protein PGTG_03455 [Puccinia graminis f. sp. tritici CRL 75-36-700-3]EFP77499.2 hypothetical protein PGTG_03455 [Puccinia graminis f. sp. tritici CRL 75-36-700-3]
MEILSDDDILYSVLGGLQPGGTCLSWIAGLITCEALRLTQRFDDNTSWDKRFFVYFSLLMSVTLAGLFAAMLYHYCIESYGNYRSLLQVTTVVRCHYIFGRVATCGGYSFYAHSVWASTLGKVKICKVPIVKVFTALLMAGLYTVVILGIPQAFTVPTFQTVAEHGSSGLWGRVVQLICGSFLTLLRAYDLAQSKAVRQMLATNNDSLRYISSVLCLVCQTAIFTTLFEVISLCLRNTKGAGIGYTMMSLSAEVHLFGPIMAISATLQEDFLAEQASTCSVGKSECKAAAPPTTKRLTFQTQEKRLMKGY